MIKARLVRLSGKGLAGAQAHLRYIQRDGTTRDGAPGELYGATSDRADGKQFLERSLGDRHQFRFIVSAEDGALYDDLKPLTRRLMARMEQDLGTRLDWVAVDHFNTGFPHTHIMLRGRDDQDQDLIIARDYLASGMRERAAELVDLDLGPRTTRSVQIQLRKEVTQERLTSIDRALLRDQDAARLVSANGKSPFDQTIRIGRLRTLERLGLAQAVSANSWRLAPDLAATLRTMGERGDIIRTMQRALAERGRTTAADEQAIYEPSAGSAPPLIGRLVERGLADEHADRHFVIIEATDGRTHYVDSGVENSDDARVGSIVRVDPVAAEVRAADRTIAAVAAANGGLYDVDAHLRHDPAATESFALTHVRRLEAMRRLAGAIERQPDGSWIIAPDHLDRVQAFEVARARNQPVTIKLLSSAPLERLEQAQGATWLDTELTSKAPLPLREHGFGQDARIAVEQRRQWLIAQGLAEENGDQTVYRPGLVELLRRRELLRIANALSDELGLKFVEVGPGEHVDGVLRRPVEALSGRYALIERSRDFTLVPWRPVLERHFGKSVSGLVRRSGVSWDIGRGRSGPSIS